MLECEASLAPTHVSLLIGPSHFRISILSASLVALRKKLKKTDPNIFSILGLGRISWNWKRNFFAHFWLGGLGWFGFFARNLCNGRSTWKVEQSNYLGYDFMNKKILEWSNSARKFMKIFWAQTFSTQSLPGPIFFKPSVHGGLRIFWVFASLLPNTGCFFVTVTPLKS